VCLGEVESIQDGNDISHKQRQSVRRRIMRFVARPMPTRIYEDDLMISYQRFDIAVIPCCKTSGNPFPSTW